MYERKKIDRFLKKLYKNNNNNNNKNLMKIKETLRTIEKKSMKIKKVN
jgi:uncharacterized protein Yka (UPF0111/DUF47 family)